MRVDESGQSGTLAGSHADLALQVQMLKTRMDVVLPTLATREQLQQEIGTLRGEMRHEFGAVRGEIKDAVGALRAEIGGLRSEMHQTFTNALRWWVGVALTSIVAAATVATALTPLLQSSSRVREAMALVESGEDADATARE